MASLSKKRRPHRDAYHWDGSVKISYFLKAFAREELSLAVRGSSCTGTYTEVTDEYKLRQGLQEYSIGGSSRLEVIATAIEFSYRASSLVEAVL